MAIRKDKKTGIWQIDISIDGRPRIQRSSFTTVKKDAQELDSRIKNEVWRQVNLGDQPKARWSDLVDLWLESKALDGKRSIEDDRDKLRWLHPHFENGKKLVADINGAFMQGVLDAKRKEGRISKSVKNAGTFYPLSNATINRYGSLLHSMMQMAQVKGWISSTPSFVKLKEIRERISYLTYEEAAELLYELPDEYVPLVRFALATGLRQSNLTELLWVNVDMARCTGWTWSDEFKGNADFNISFNDDAMEVLQGQIGKSKEYVFPNSDGIPYPYPASKAFHSALKRIGREGFHWHDLRHTWATWHVMSGTPLEVLQKLGGWKSLAMVLRYAHLAKSHLESHARNISLPPIASKVKPSVDLVQNSCEV